ncbi:MAG: polysaccharide biosynthesis C-terminal domain-containing protein [Ruminococcus flavefaciens]|nr:polysaccharide biosynthesis C-terminal domain-containing protein [Ruminococcus flavefaciens]
MNKYKKLAMNTIVFAIGNFGSKILVILLTRLYSNNINPADSSTKELLEITANFLLPIFTFSMTEAIIRYGLDKKYRKKEVFTTAMCLNLVGLALMFVFTPILRLVPFLDFIDGYTILLLVYVCTSAIRSMCSQFVRARGHVKLYSFDGILATLTLFIFNIIFISKLHWGVKGFMLSVILSDLCSSLFLFVIADLRKYLHISYYNKRLAWSMMKFALPLIPTVVMWVITGFSDRLFIRYMKSDMVTLGEDAAGIYGYASKIPNLISMISTIFFQAWNMSAIMENDSKDRSNFYEKIYTAYESILFIASAVLVAGVKIITPLFVSSKNFEEYGDVYIYTPVLVVAVLFMCLDQFLSSIYTATKHTKNSFWTSFVASIANIILNYFLIPVWGIQGASISTFLSYYLCFWARIIDARYYVPFRFNGFRSIINTTAILLMCIFMIATPKFYGLWTFLLLAFILVINYNALMLTAKKLLRK